MSKIRDIQTIDEFEILLKDLKNPFYLFKHSTICPISSRAHHNVETFMAENPDIPVYRVLVIESRPLSYYVSDFFSIKHESPQIFLISDQTCLWHSSHLAITEDAMKKQLELIEN